MAWKVKKNENFRGIIDYNSASKEAGASESAFFYNNLVFVEFIHILCRLLWDSIISDGFFKKKA